MDPAVATRNLRAVLARQGTPERAAHEKAYLKSPLVFLGTPVPVIRREAKAFARAHPELDRVALRRLLDTLWASDVHELRSVGIGILEVRSDLLRAGDADWLIGLVRSVETWAHVDWLSVKVLGALLEKEPRIADKLARWARDPNFWVRRTALLALHDPLLAGRGDFERFTRLAIPLLADRQFFIRKALGWVLRSASRRTPERTIDFVSQHASEMSALTFKEATRNLPAQVQKRLRALRVGQSSNPKARPRKSAAAKRTTSPIRRD